MYEKRKIIDLLDKRTDIKNTSLDDEIQRELSKTPLLTGINVPAALFLRGVIECIVQDDMQAALDEVFRLSENEIPDEFAENYLLLAVNICASFEYAEGWVLFNKNYIRYLMDNNRINEALAVISNLEDVLHDDSDIKSFRIKIGAKKIEHLAIVGMNKGTLKLIDTISSAPYDEKYSISCIYDYTGNIVNKKHRNIAIVTVEQLVEMYHNRYIDRVIIANSGYSKYRLSMICKVLKNAGIVDRVFLVPPWFYDGAYDFVHETLQPFDCATEHDLDSIMIKADMSKDVLDFIIAFSNLHCNSSCISCVTASPLAEPMFVSLASYQRDIKRLKELYWHICRFRISGGEPLLHPDIADMVSITREAFPATGFAIQTNGLLLLKDDGRFDDLLKVMCENRCGFQISTYKPIMKQREKLRDILLKHGVQWHWAQVSGKPIEDYWFFRTLLPTNDMEEQHRTCYTDKRCHALHEGYVYPCFMPGAAEIIEKHFGVKFEGMAENMDKMRLSLHNTELDGWGIAQFLESPSPMCSYCCFERMRKVEWKQCTREDARLDDFVLL